MHGANKCFFQWAYDKFPEYFKETIIEFGSFNVCGSVREIIQEDSQEYIGVDWRPGPDVDVVSMAHAFEHDKAKAIISASMLEHDPYWEQSIHKMVDLLTDDGILILTWGAAGNLVHCLKEAPDSQFHPLRAGLVLKILKECGMYIHTFVYDRDFIINIHTKKNMQYLKLKDGNYVATGGQDGSGEANLIAFKKYKGKTKFSILESGDAE